MANKTENLEFDWLQLRDEFDAAGLKEETTKQRMLRKFKENPFVPLGCVGTTCALCYGLWCFKTGQRKMSQYMMRTRIVAQGFTVMALIVGIGMSAGKLKE